MRGKRAIAAAISGTVLLVAAGPPEASADSRVVDSYCSSTGDYCQQVVKQASGTIKIRWASFSYPGKYKLCVKGAGTDSCRRFKSKLEGELYQDSVVWQKKFPDGGPGRYKVKWFYRGGQVGKTLEFRSN